LYGYIERHLDPKLGAIVVANPTYRGPGSHAVVDHTELVIDAAEKEDIFGQWRWDTGPARLLTKVGETPQSAAGGIVGKQMAAASLPDVLRITDPPAIAGRRIVIYDDVCTTGLQLNAVARFLRGHGASEVEAIVLARAPWIP
jgi:hypothetical protein